MFGIWDFSYLGFLLPVLSALNLQLSQGMRQRGADHGGFFVIEFLGETRFGAVSGFFGRNPPVTPVDKVADSYDSAASSGVWVIGMRYKILDANTTEQVAQGYTEEKMELGAESTSVAGISSAAEGGLTLDSLVQRLVKKNVYEIDSKYK